MRTIAVALCFCCFAQTTPTAENEQRDFSILVNGRDAGHSRIHIAEADGTTVATISAQVKVNLLILPYTYSVESTETWKDGKLIGLKASSVENGKHTEITASGDGGRLTLRINGHDRLVAPDVWTSSFWKLADPKYHNKAVQVLEPDTGKEYTCQLQYVGTEQLTYMKQLQSCYHFRISGGPYPVDAWFDRFHRLVRQEFVDSGHKTIMQLIDVKR